MKVGVSTLCQSWNFFSLLPRPIKNGKIALLTVFSTSVVIKQQEKEKKEEKGREQKKKAWEVRREIEENERNDTSVESHEEPQPSTSKAQSEYDDFLDRTAPKNMSELKLMNSSFEKLDQQEAVTTRSQSGTAEICVHEEAHGYKMRSYYQSALLFQLFAARAEIQSQNCSYFKIAQAEMALLYWCIWNARIVVS